MLEKHNKNVKKDQKYVRILDTDVLSTTLSEVLTGINNEIAHNNKITVFTPNPELILMASRHKSLRNILNKNKYNVPDGVGLNYASLFLYGKGINIIPGRKLFMDMLSLASEHSYRVYFLGGQGREAELAALKVKSEYKNIKIISSPGPNLTPEAKNVSEVDKKSYIDTVKEINKFKPHFLFVAFGNPKQEIWLSENLDKLNVNCAVTVGGAFRYFAGLSKNTPDILSNLGFEWLWRLITEPKRFVRVINAVAIFPLAVFKSKVTIRLFG